MIIAARNRMGEYFTRTWELAFLEGMVALVVSVLLMFQRARSAVFPVQVLGVYLLGNGMCKILAAAYDRSEQGWWLKFAGGLLFASAGMISFVYPPLRLPLTVGDLALVMSVLTVLGGIMVVGWSMSNAGMLQGEAWTPVSGFLGLVFGLILFSAPLMTLQGFSFLVSLIALWGGVFFFFSSLRMRALSRSGDTVPRPMREREKRIHVGGA